MDFAYILFAFACGLAVKTINLPPLIGFLCAGFLLNALGYQASPALSTLAELGITLMLFTIGLKLNIRDLIKREVWLGSISHAIVWIGISSGLFMLLAYLGAGHFALLSWSDAALLAFALSFSSTVCIVKLLEDSGEIKTRHGKLAVGILIMQDIFAVVFLVVATGKTPTLWALLLPLLLFTRPVWRRLLEATGHGELLPLTGFMFALGAYELFELVGVKGDLGALIVGMIIARHPKSTELAKALMGFKDLFLIGFFLSIGFTALPTLDMVITALILCTLLPLKFAAFFRLFTGLRLRARTAYLGSLVLGNYSEFGLIVIALLVSLGTLPQQWLVILAIAVSISFLFTGFSYRHSHQQYRRLKDHLRRYQHPIRLAEDTYIQPTNAKVLVMGLGRVGKGAYTALANVLGDCVWGMDADPVRIRRLQQQGLQALVGDGEDIDFWENTDLSGVELVLLAVPSTEDISNITGQLRAAGFTGKVAAIARYEDEIQPLLDAGSDKVFNFFTEAGTGFAEESLQLIKASPKYETSPQ
ncbi:cation:proton antiporter [Aestuariibacter halophilus]|uniref:Cation:proton antiporter n=1 Tax=Fluctibacter halophilus TaxID=226011 RepID=A0ABS8G7P6_9ALTE|nr:cation:proton antiporter family protein [Aestuariibacter halophilus]MCC2615699.1 cation:proton antiporter [Aestuariibacter halophilus]